MRTTTKALVVGNWGYVQVSPQATADLLKGKDVMVLSYKVGKVIDSRVDDDKVTLTLEVELPDRDV